jgi:hypothetical protein
MKAFAARSWWLILLAYPVSGLALGLADPVLGQAAGRLGVRPGLATFASVNLILPAVAVALGLAHARVAVAWLGAAAMTLGLTAGLAVRNFAGAGGWSLGGLLGAVPPVLVAAGVGYGVLGTAAALARGAWRRRAGTPGG